MLHKVFATWSCQHFAKQILKSMTCRLSPGRDVLVPILIGRVPSPVLLGGLIFIPTDIPLSKKS